MKPTVVWLTGLLCKEKYKTGLIDSDNLRLSVNIGFSIKDRARAVNEMVYAVRNMLEFQKAEIVIVASISPLRAMRDNARHILEKYSRAEFIEVFMDTPLEVCEERDVKGLYKKARAGLIKDFTGIDSPYEAPEFPEVWITTKSPYCGEMTVEKAANIIYNKIHEEGTTTN
jgi:adenylyl-sulfate kinase